MKLKIIQVGESVLRQRAHEVTTEDIRSPDIQHLIEHMRETMRDAPGVGLAAPQLGVPLRIAVVEDRAEYLKDISADVLAERGRVPLAFHVVINPVIELRDGVAEFFEGCLSVPGLSALVPRASQVRVRALNESAKPVVINAQGWHARILQHEIDHLDGVLYVDRMQTRSLTTTDNLSRYWKSKSIQQVREELRVLTTVSGG